MYIKHHYKHFDVLDLCWYNITIRKYIPYASINRFPIHQAETFESKYNLKISRCHWIDYDNVHEVRNCINAIFVFTCPSYIIQKCFVSQSKSLLKSRVKYAIMKNKLNEKFVNYFWPSKKKVHTYTMLH